MSHKELPLSLLLLHWQNNLLYFKLQGVMGYYPTFTREGTLHSKRQGSLKLAYKLPHLLYTNDAFTQLLQSNRAKSLVF